MSTLVDSITHYVTYC